MNKLLNNLLGMYKQAKLAKKAVTEIFDDQTLAMVKGIFADEQNYPTAEDITEALRSLNTNGDLSNEQYDYIQNNWEEFLKFSSKNTNLTKKASAFKVVKMTNNDFVDLSDSIKDVGDELWGIVYGKIVHVVAVIVFENKVLYEPLINDEETQKIYDEAQTGSIETVELLPGDDTYAAIGFAVKESSKGKKLTKKAGYSNNPDYFGDWFGKGQIDFSKIINPNDSGDVWMVKLWGGKGYILDVYLVKADDYYDAVDKVFEWSYENEGANKIVFDRENLEEEALEYFKDEPNMFGKELEKEDFIDRFLEEYYVANEDYSLFAREENFFANQVPEEYLKGNKQSSKAKSVRKQAKNKEIVVTYEGTDGKEYIVKAPNGLYFNEYVDTDTQHSRGAGPFETLEKAKEMFKKHRPSAKEVVATKKQATIVEKYKNDFSGYTDTYQLETIEKNLNQYDIDDIKSELSEAKRFVSKMDKLKRMPHKDVGNYYYMKDKALIAEKLIEEKTKNKMGKSATIKHENGVYNVYSESGKCLGKGYKTKEEAEKRLKQVEYFKHKSSLKQVVISKMAEIKK